MHGKSIETRHIAMDNWLGNQCGIHLWMLPMPSFALFSTISHLRHHHPCTSPLACWSSKEILCEVCRVVGEQGWAASSSNNTDTKCMEHNSTSIGADELVSVAAHMLRSGVLRKAGHMSDLATNSARPNIQHAENSREREFRC